MLQGAGVRGDAARGNGTAAQGPEEALIPMVADVLALNIGERARDTLISVVHRLIDGRAIFRGKAVFFIPDVQRRVLKRNGIDVLGFNLHDGIHGWAALRILCSSSPGPISTEQ